jgi:hypothetical protein
LLCAACLLVGAGPLRASAPPAVYLVTNTNDSGAGSLRQAILNSNASVGVGDEIDFNIPGSGVQTITPVTPLPVITDSVLLDGQSQPGYDGVHPLIQLDGSQLAAPNAVLTITGGAIQIYGLGIIRGPDAGIRITGGVGGNVIGNCTIGTDPTGTIAQGNATHGIVIDNSASNNISYTSPSRRNVIGGNGIHGVFVTGAAATGNLVHNNAIGTDWSLHASVPNGGYGVLCSDANGTDVQYCDIVYNRSGGVAVQGAVSGGFVGFNSISSNGGPGISVLAAATGVSLESNVLTGNAGIGIDLNGDGRTPNDTGDGDSGPNNLQNFPVLSNVIVTQDNNSGRFCTLTIQLHSEPNTAYIIYPYPGVPGSIPGDTQVIGPAPNSTLLTTDATGFAETVFFLQIPQGSSVIVATATDPSGNTSELSDPLFIGDTTIHSGCGATGAEVLLPLFFVLRRRIRARR